jgi:Flp pilus assembly pilin Flp
MQGQSFSRLAQKLVARIEWGLRCGWKETTGQDLIEYTLMAGFVAVSAAALSPNIAISISTIVSKVTSVMTAAGTQPS